MSFYGWDSPDIVYLYSASGKKLIRVFREMRVKAYVDKNPQQVFDTGNPEDKAKVAADTSDFEFAFGPDVQPQNISDAYEKFIGMSDSRRSYWERHQEKIKQANKKSKNRLGQ